MQKKNRKKILSALFMISLLSFFFIAPSKVNSPLQVAEKFKLKHKDKTQHQKPIITTKKNNRLPASYKQISKKVPLKLQVPLHQRNILNSNKSLKNIQIANKYNKDWEKIYTKNFLRITGKEKVSNFKTIKKRSVIKVENNKTGILLELSLIHI